MFVSHFNGVGRSDAHVKDHVFIPSLFSENLAVLELNLNNEGLPLKAYLLKPNAKPIFHFYRTFSSFYYSQIFVGNGKVG
jgi:hypothetical protein